MTYDKQNTEHPHESRGLRPRFDPTLNWGHLLTAASFVLFGIGAWYSVKQDVERIDMRMVFMEKTVGTMASSLSTLVQKDITDARQDERISSITRRVERLETSAGRQ